MSYEIDDPVVFTVMIVSVVAALSLMVACPDVWVKTAVASINKNYCQYDTYNNEVLFKVYDLTLSEQNF